MDLGNPPALVLPHLHAMALALYFYPQAQYVLELGLGGGAMQRYLHKALPDAKIHTLENNSAVIQSATDFFGLNPQKVSQIDASSGINQFKRVDLLFVDLFGRQDHPHCLHQADFLKACLQTLSAQGVMVLNLLPSSATHTEDWLAFLHLQCGFAPLCFAIPQYQNKVILCATRPLKLPDMQTLAVYAKDGSINLDYLTLYSL